MDARELARLRTDLASSLDDVAGDLGHPRRRWCDASPRGLLLDGLWPSGPRTRPSRPSPSSATGPRRRASRGWPTRPRAGGGAAHSYREPKGEPGLDPFEGRSWRGRNRHVALVLLAYPFRRDVRRRRPKKAAA